MVINQENSIASVSLDAMSHPDYSLLCMFLCFGWSGCELGGQSMFVFLGFGYFYVSA